MAKVSFGCNTCGSKHGAEVLERDLMTIAIWDSVVGNLLQRCFFGFWGQLLPGTHGELIRDAIVGQLLGEAFRVACVARIGRAFSHDLWALVWMVMSRA